MYLSHERLGTERDVLTFEIICSMLMKDLVYLSHERLGTERDVLTFEMICSMLMKRLHIYCTLDTS